MTKKLLSFVMALAIVFSSMSIAPAREVAAEAATQEAKQQVSAEETQQIAKEIEMSQSVGEELSELAEAGELAELVDNSAVGTTVSSGTVEGTQWSLQKGVVASKGILTEGEGSLSQTLSNGQSVELRLDNSVMTLVVNSSKWNYYDTPCVGTAVISDDDVLHVFWHSGHYYGFDLYEPDAYVLLGYHGVDGYNVDYYVVTQPNDPNVVLGTSAGMANKTCILDKQYFKMYGQVLKKRLITRAQLEELIYGKKPTPTPTVVPTQEPTSVPTTEPTLAPTQEPTLVPTAVPTKAPTPTLKPLPTQKPSGTPDVTIDTTIDWTQKTEFEVYLEWQKNFAAQMTWYAFAQAVWGKSWKEHATSITISDTRYEYDENGNLIHQYTISNSETKTEGQNAGAANAQTGGTATATGTESGAAHLTGSTYNEGKAVIHTEVKKSSSKKSSSNSKDGWSVREPIGKVGYVCLVRTVNGKAGVVCKVKVDYKKHIAWFDGKPYKNMKHVFYSSKSRQILILYRNNTWDVVARAKGKAGTKYTTKRLKGKWNKFNRIANGLVNRIMRVKKGKKIVVKGVSNVQPKKLKKKK